ncbi:alpha/beta hydrolase [Rhodobacteraceae bacterium M385]|nr:alpha/beta hydrolase [Rhodobacteraceae bacterium M385]
MGIDPSDGRRWILLPGTLCTGAVFDGFLDALKVPRTARCFVDMEWENVGDYAAVLDDVAAPDAIVCGFSLGAIVAAHLADRLDVSALLLFGLNPHADDPAKRDERLELARDVAAIGGNAALTGRLPPLAGNDPEQARAFVLSMAHDTQRFIEAQTALALGRPGALSALAGAACPVSMMTGTDDQQTPLSLAQEAAAAAPNGRAVALDGLGHYALVEDPITCARAVSGVWTPQ